MKTVYILRKELDKFININFHQAYNWFNQRYYNIKFFNSNDINTFKIDKDTIIVAWINELKTIFKNNNIKIQNIEIPLWCESYLKREIQITTVNEAIKLYNQWYRFFIKPLDNHKSFPWFCFTNYENILKFNNDNLDERVIISDIIEIKSEYRFFILESKIIWFSLYSWDPEILPDIQFVKDIIRTINLYNNYPVAYSIDIWINSNNEPFLIETNDSIALGAYWLNAIKYSLMIEKRWEEITKDL